MIKRMISTALAIVMTLSLTIVSVSGADTASDASTNLVYYDLQSQPTGQFRATTTAWKAASGYSPAGGFIGRENYSYATITNTNGVNELAVKSSFLDTTNDFARFALNTSALNAEGDYSVPLRKVTLAFKTSIPDGADACMYDFPARLWFNLWAVSAKGLKEIEATENHTMSDSLRAAIEPCADTDLILFFWDVNAYGSGTTDSKTMSSSGYIGVLNPIANIGTVGQDYTSVEYIYKVESESKIVAREIKIGSEVKATLMDNTTSVSGIEFEETSTNAMMLPGNLCHQEDDSPQYVSMMGCYLNPDGTVEFPTQLSKRGDRTTLWFNELKYEGIRFIEEINVGEDEEAVPVYGDELIKIKFGLKPYSPETIVWSDIITITDESNAPVTNWTGEYVESENAYKITVAQDSPFEHSKQYNVKVEGAIPLSADSSEIINKVKSFVTDYKKLIVESELSSVPSEAFSVPITVTNNSLESGLFTATAALYEKKSGVVNMIASKELTRTQALSLGESDTISVGPLAYTPAEGAEYFVKVFFTENNKPIASPIVIGTVKNPDGDETTGAPDENGLKLFTDNDTGRIKLEGTYSETVKKPIFVTVTDTTLEVVYVDQLSVSDDGEFGLDFNLIPEKPIYATDPYNVNVALYPIIGSAVTKEVSMYFSNLKPTVSNLGYGDVVPYCDGRSLPAEYDYFHFGGAESASIVNWYEYNEEYPYDTANSVLIQADLPTITLTEALKGKEIYFTVLARTTAGATADAPVASEKIKLTAGPVASNVQISQSGNTLSFTYDYSHGLGYEELGTVYSWYRADSAAGDYTKLDYEGSAYTITASDEDKYFKVEVLPKSLLTLEEDTEDTEEETEIDIERIGVSEWSTPHEANYTAPADDGGSGGGGGGGGGGRAPKENKVEVTPVDTSGTIDLTDIKGHWAENDIYNLYDKGIVKGRTEHTFDPEGKITRAEFVALIVRALNLGEAANTSFSDVNANDWYAGVLGKAFETGILSGSEGNAYPNRQITRQEMAAITVRALELNGEGIALDGDILEFDDAAKIDLWAIEAVAKAKQAGLIKGDGSNYRPLDNTSRAEATVIISRLLAMQ